MTLLQIAGQVLGNVILFGVIGALALVTAYRLGWIS